MGGSNYSRILPPHSYINVQDFEDPEHLAKYLKYLDGNATAYMEYFGWHKYYRVRVSQPLSK